MDQSTLQKLKNTLSQATDLGILVGANPTVDDMGSALALYLSLKTAQRKVTIASVTEPIVELSSLVGIDQVRNSLGNTAAGDLVVSFPYKEGEIEKVSYTLENGQLNIVVKAGELGLNFADEDVRFTHGGGANPSVLIGVAAPNFAEIQNLINVQEMPDVQIVNIDNKPENQGYGDVAVVNPQASSLSEQMAEILLSLNMPLDQDIAQNLLSGISYGTGNFQDPRTTSLAFEMAGELMRLGARRIASPMQPQAPRQQAPSAPRYQPAQTADDMYAQPAPAAMMNNQQPPRGVSQMPAGMSQTPDRGPQQQRVNNQQQRQQAQPRPQVQQQQRQQMPQPRPVNQPPVGVQSPMSMQARQDQIRAELARAAAQGGQAQPEPYVDAPGLVQSAPEPVQEAPTQRVPAQPRPQSNGRAQNPPSDWLTPKVYKGSTDVDTNN